MKIPNVVVADDFFSHIPIQHGNCYDYLLPVKVLDESVFLRLINYTHGIICFYT